MSGICVHAATRSWRARTSRPHGRPERRAPRPRSRRPSVRAVTNAEYFYDYAAQDPVNGYDLTGAMVEEGGVGGRRCRGLACGENGLPVKSGGQPKGAGFVKGVVALAPSDFNEAVQLWGVVEAAGATAVAAGATVVIVVVACPAATATGGPVGAVACGQSAVATATLAVGAGYATYKEAKLYAAKKRKPTHLRNYGGR